MTAWFRYGGLAVAALAWSAAFGAGKKTFANPVLPGFYPDPSVCKGPDGKFCLATSSFQYFPAIPLFESKDLVHWELKGHAITDPAATVIAGGLDIGGVFAPTLRWHDGKFYLVFFNNSPEVPASREAKRLVGTLMTTAPALEGPWSKPVPIPSLGGDPSLDFIDGKCYYTAVDRGRMIRMAEFDPVGCKLLTEPRDVWSGTGGRYPEGSHVFKRDGWYYLTIAEGGTEYGHRQTIARSRSVFGPYEPSPHGDVVTHARLAAQHNKFQAVGHGDFVSDAGGESYFVCHAIRPQWGKHHWIGRETVVAPVTWTADGWPLVNGGEPIPDSTENVSRLPAVDWIWLRNPELGNYDIDTDAGTVSLQPSFSGLSGYSSPTFIGTRQTAVTQTFRVKLLRQPAGGVTAGITAYMSRRARYDLACVKRGGKCYAFVRYALGSMDFKSEKIEVDPFPAELRIEADRRSFRLFVDSQLVGEGDPRHISSETDNSYTGVVFGMFAEGSPASGKIHFAYDRDFVLSSPSR
jgi:alpha-N-arabinofuranosidase